MKMLQAEIMFNTEIIPSLKGLIILYIFINQARKTKKRKMKTKLN